MLGAALILPGALLTISASWLSKLSQSVRAAAQCNPCVLEQIRFRKECSQLKTYEEVEEHTQRMLMINQHEWRRYPLVGFSTARRPSLYGYQFHPDIPLWREIWVENLKSTLAMAICLPVHYYRFRELQRHVRDFYPIFMVLEQEFPDHLIATDENNIIMVYDYQHVPCIQMPTRLEWEAKRFLATGREFRLGEPTVAATFDLLQAQDVQRLKQLIDKHRAH